MPGDRLTSPEAAKVGTDTDAYRIETWVGNRSVSAQRHRSPEAMASPPKCQLSMCCAVAGTISLLSDLVLSYHRDIVFSTPWNQFVQERTIRIVQGIQMARRPYCGYANTMP